MLSENEHNEDISQKFKVNKTSIQWTRVAKWIVAIKNNFQ